MQISNSPNCWLLPRWPSFLHLRKRTVPKFFFVVPSSNFLFFVFITIFTFPWDQIKPSVWLISQIGLGWDFLVNPDCHLSGWSPKSCRDSNCFCLVPCCVKWHRFLRAQQWKERENLGAPAPWPFGPTNGLGIPKIMEKSPMMRCHCG